MNISSASRSFQLLTRILDTKNATEPFLPPSGEKISLPLRAAEQPFPRATPESEGISSDHIRSFLETLGRGGDLYMQDVMILRHGKLLCAAAYGAQTLDAPKYTFSACKSVTSLAIGLLMDDGLLRPEDSVAALFAEELTPATQRRIKTLTVDDLLTMRSGIQFSELQTQTDGDWLHGIFSEAPGFDPGTQFQYNSLNSYLLSAIVVKISGKSMSDFLKKRLFDPMGITDIYWECCPAGIEKGGWGLYIRPEDMAKLGQLVMNGGVWNGKKLLSRAYIASATKAHTVPPEGTGDFDYGYHIWVGRKENTFLFNGMLGQNVLGFKDSGILIVTNAGADTDYQESRYFEIVSRYFGGSFPTVLPEDPEAQERLQRCVKDLSFYNRSPISPGEQANLFLHRSFHVSDEHAASTGLLPMVLQIVHNCYTSGLSGIAISARGQLPELIYRENAATYRLNVGLGVPEITELCIGGNYFHVAAHGRFTHDEEERPVFYIRLDFLETPCVRIIKLILTEEGAILKQTETPGVPYLYGKLRSAASQPLYKPLLLVAAGGSEDDFLHYKSLKIMAPEIRMITE